jgi:glycosyltransferase involved in cell wall biosynthesis
VSATFVGDGPLREDLERASRGRNLLCKFSGWIEEWEELAADHDVLVLPSSVEGFGNVLIEAAARNLPVVACSDALATADAVAVGVTGELATEPSGESLARAIIAASDLQPAVVGKKFLSRFLSGESTDRLLEVLALAKASADAK